MKGAFNRLSLNLRRVRKSKLKERDKERAYKLEKSTFAPLKVVTTAMGGKGRCQ